VLERIALSKRQRALVADRARREFAPAAPPAGPPPDTPKKRKRLLDKLRRKKA
jgi:hypothetical protein